MSDERPATEVDAELLRPALEQAFVLVRADTRSRPPVEPPPSLKPYLRFRKLRGPALAAVRGVLDDDSELRSRVADALDDDSDELVDVWLRRPDGWEGIVDGLVAEHRAEAAQADAGQREAELRSRLDAMSAELAAAEAARAEAEQAATKADERRRRAVERVTDESRRADDAAARVEVLTERAQSAEERARAAEASLGEERQRVRALREELAQRTVSAVEPPPSTPTDGASDPGPEAVHPPTVDLDAAGRAVAAASAGARTLAEALDELRSLLTPPAPVDPTPLDHPSERPARRRRRPLVLPGLAAESVEAARWLLSRPDVVVLVDGYNVTLRRWPRVPLPDQRRHLIDRLSMVCSGGGPDVRVVFDGADDVNDDPLPPRCPVAVEFTATELEADDRIIDLTASLPADRPVVVVTSDHRVRDGSARHGANLIDSDTFLAALPG